MFCHNSGPDQLAHPALSGSIVLKSKFVLSKPAFGVALTSTNKLCLEQKIDGKNITF